VTPPPSVGDESQQLIDTRATAVAGLEMGIFSLVLALVAIARGSDNPWVVVCLVGAVSYVVALAVLVPAAERRMARPLNPSWTGAGV
jgi:hypothetical protein